MSQEPSNNKGRAMMWRHVILTYGFNFNLLVLEIFYAISPNTVYTLYVHKEEIKVAIYSAMLLLVATDCMM